MFWWLKRSPWGLGHVSMVILLFIDSSTLLWMKLHKQNQLPVKLWGWMGSWGFGTQRASCWVLAANKTLATVKWSQWSASTTRRFSISCLQCSWTNTREWSRPKKSMWSIKGTWIDQSTSTPSTTISVSSITARLHLNETKGNNDQLIQNKSDWLSSVLYLWKPLLGWVQSGRYSVSGAKYPPYSGIGRGCGWGMSNLLGGIFLESV